MRRSLAFRFVCCSFVSDSSAPASRRVLPLLFVGVLLAAFDLAMTGPVIPALRETFGLAPRAASWMFGIFVLFNLMGVPLLTRLADRWGRRRVFAASLVGFGMGAGLVAIAPSYAVVLVGRGVQGVAASGIFPVATAVVGDVYPSAHRGRALGILGAVYGLAFLIGPAVAGVVMAVSSWTWLYAALVPLAMSVAGWAWQGLPVSEPRDGRGIDGVGIVALGGTLALLAIGINQLDTTAPLTSLLQPTTGGLVLLSCGGAIAFVVAERRAADPLLRLSLFRDAQVVRATVLAIGAGMVETSFIFFADLAVVAFDVPQSTASFMLLPLVGAVAIGSPIAGRLLDRLGAPIVVQAGTALLTIGLALLALFPTHPGAFYGGSVVLGLGLAVLLGSALSYILLEAAAEEERTVVQGLNALSLGIGQLLGSAGVGAIAASASGVVGYANAFALLTGVGAACAAVAWGLRRTSVAESVPKEARS